MADNKPKAPIPPAVPPVAPVPPAPTPEETKKSQAEADKQAEEDQKAKEQQAKADEKQASLNKRAEVWKRGLEENNATQTPDFVEVYNELLGEKETFNGYNIADDERRRTKFLQHFQPKQTKNK